jgi:hypothetical protein
MCAGRLEPDRDHQASHALVSGAVGFWFCRAPPGAGPFAVWNRRAERPFIYTDLTPKNCAWPSQERRIRASYEGGRPIIGGTDINSTDAGFAARIYPKPGHQGAVASAPTHVEHLEHVEADDWGRRLGRERGRAAQRIGADVALAEAGPGETMWGV